MVREEREKERKNGAPEHLRLRQAALLDDGALAAAGQCTIFDTLIKGKRIKKRQIQIQKK